MSKQNASICTAVTVHPPIQLPVKWLPDKTGLDYILYNVSLNITRQFFTKSIFTFCNLSSGNFVFCLTQI